MKKQTRTGYMCAIDFAHELGEAPGGILVYRDKKDALAHCPCVTSCGLVKVTITEERRVIKGDLYKGAKKMEAQKG